MIKRTRLLAEAKTRLQRAFELEARYRLRALEDEDIEPPRGDLEG